MKNKILPIILCLAMVLGSTNVIYADSKAIIKDSDVTRETEQTVEQVAADSDAETVLPDDEGAEAADGTDMPEKSDNPDNPDSTDNAGDTDVSVSPEDADSDTETVLPEDEGSDAADGTDIPYNTDNPDVTDSAEEAVYDAETALPEDDGTKSPEEADLDVKTALLDDKETDAAHHPISKVAVESTEYVYTGSEITPAAVVYDENDEIIPAEKYTVEYVNNVDAGTAAVTVNGKDEYTGESAETTFKITRAVITDAVLKYTSLKYTGKNRTQNKTTKVYCGDTLLTIGKDYSITYANCNKAGTATMTIKGKGNYQGTLTRTYQITRANITNAVLKYTSLQYTGKKRTQTRTTQVYCGDTLLTRNRDYTISYANCLKIGTATMTIKGKGNYKGTLTRTYKIIGIPIRAVRLAYDSVTYNSEAWKPAVTVKTRKDGKVVTLKKGTDYSVSYKDNTNAGTATVIVKGKGLFSGTIKKNFTIKKVKLADAVLEYTAVVYEDRVVPIWEPDVKSVTAKVNKQTVSLIEGEDYTVSYKNNTGIGIASVIIKGKGNYKGSLVKNFQIAGKEEDVKEEFLKDGYWSWKDLGLKYTCRGCNTSFETYDELEAHRYSNSANDYECLRSNWSWETIQELQYTIGSDARVIISPDDVQFESATLSKTSFAYTGKAIKPVKYLTVVDEYGDTCVYGEDYTVSYKNNINRGTATIIVKGLNEYSHATIKATFTIK